ncbi:MAG: YndJ family transporter [Candidatus Xenobia bacterium]
MLLASALLSLAILLGVPLALSCSATPEPPRLYRTVRALCLPTGLAAAVALFLPRGPLAAGLAVPWLLQTGLLALWGLLRLLSRKERPIQEILFSVGLIYVPAGAIWLVASRYGHGFLGFAEPLVLLTAVHWHFTGCLLPALTGLVGRSLPAGHRPYRILAIGIIVLPILVAVGITGSRPIEIVAGVGLAVCVIGIAGLGFRQAPLPMLCGMLAMLLAAGYAAHRVLPWTQMVPSHGVFNSIFTLVGLWMLRKTETRLE